MGSGGLATWGWAAALAVGVLHAWETYCYHHKLNNINISEQKVVALKTENGFYYSYYEEVVSAPTWFQGVWSAVRDRRSEAPDTINAVQRFNIYQELWSGLAFRFLRWVVGDLAPDAWYFFRYCLYAINGAGRAALLGLAAACGGGGLRGGLVPCLIVGLMLFLHHYECSRFHETSIINLREYWACPVIWIQVFCLHRLLANHPDMAGSSKLTERKASLVWRAAFVLATVTCILLWQFSAFAFVLQVAALFLCTLLSHGDGPRLAALDVMRLYLISLSVSIVMLFFNELLIHHVLVTECLCIYIVLRRKPRRNRALFWVDGVIAVALFLVIRLVQSPFASADEHLPEIFAAKMQKLFPNNTYFAAKAKKPTFNAQLYLAVSVFDFISYSSIEALMPTKVLHGAFAGVAVVVVGFFRWVVFGDDERSTRSRTEGMADCMPSLRAASFAHGVLVVQLIFFCALGCFLDRLKILPGPLLCLLAGVALSRQPIEALIGRWTSDCSRTCKIIRFVVFLAALAGQLAQLVLLASKVPFLEGRSDRVHQEMTWGDADVGELCDWMTRNLPANATIMDSMSLAGQVRAVTPHRHVIHPQFESKSLRARVQEIYKFYQCATPEEFVPTMKKFGADYIVIEYRRCDFSPYPLDEFPEVNCNKDTHPWEDLFCVRMHTTRQYKMIFANSGYAIFQMRPDASEKKLSLRAPSIEDMGAWSPMLKRCQRDEPQACGPRVAELADMWYSKLRRPAIANLLFEWALQQKPESGQTQYIYGRHLDYEANRPQDAARYYRRAYELSPNNPLIVREYLMYLDLVGKDNRSLESLMRTRRFTKGGELSLLDLRDAALGCEAAVTAMQLMRDRDFADDLWEMAKSEGIGNSCMKNNWPLFSPGRKTMEEDLTKWGIFLNVFWHLGMRSSLASGQVGTVRWQQDRRPWIVDLAPIFEVGK